MNKLLFSFFKTKRTLDTQGFQATTCRDAFQRYE